MLQIVDIAIANALIATCLAIVVAAVTRYYSQPPVVFCLWLLVLIKLVTPPLIQVPLSAFAVPQEARTAESTGPQQMETASVSLEPQLANAVVAPSPDTPPTKSSAFGKTMSHRTSHIAILYWRECLLSISCLGTLVYVSLVIQRVWQFQRLLRLTTIAPPAFRDMARDMAETLTLRRQPRIRITAGNVSPLVWCLIPTERPVVVLPRALMSQLSIEQQTSLLAHELAHLRRGDHWVRWFEIIVTAIFWWHPVVWWARRELHRAGDQCCDAWVLWAFPQRAKTYAEALLQAIDFLAEARANVPPLASTIGQVHFLERRIQMILRRDTQKHLSRTAQLLLVTVAAVVLPISSRLVAQDQPKLKDADRPAARLAEREPALAAEDEPADEKPSVVIPKAGIVEVEITIDDKTTKTRSLKAAASQLRSKARRLDQDAAFSTVININGTTREFNHIQQATTACDTLTQILDAMKAYRVQLGDLGPIEATQASAVDQQSSVQQSSVQQPGGPRRGRDGDDGVGAGGGLGGQSGGGSLGVATGQGLAGFGQSALGAAGGQRGGAAKDQAIAQFRNAIRHVLFDSNEQRPAANGPNFDKVIASGKATLFSRLAHGSYEKATFSFEFALRDDPTNTIGNDWDLQYGSVPNHFHVTMVSDDRSRIVDLGKMDLEQLDLRQLPKLPAASRPQRDFVLAQAGHVYYVHTADRNTDLYALFRVDQLNPDNTCDISWQRIGAGGEGEPKKAELQAQQ